MSLKTAQHFLEKQRKLYNDVHNLEAAILQNSDNLANALRAERDRIGLSNADIAQGSGLKYSSVVNWLYGNVRVSTVPAQKIMDYLAVEAKKFAACEITGHHPLKRLARPRKPKPAP